MQKKKEELYFTLIWCFGSYIGALYVGHKITQEEGVFVMPRMSTYGISKTLGITSAERLVHFFQGNAFLGTVQS